jgi:acyl carrier protein
MDQIIKKVLSDQFGVDVDRINDDTTFEDLNADSIDLVEVIMILEKELKIVIDTSDEFHPAASVHDLKKLITTILKND